MVKKTSKLSNRLSYTLIAVVAVILLATGIYAADVIAGGTPNPGHSISSLGSPSLCVAGQFLQWTGVTPNGGWACANVVSSSASFWAEDAFGGITYSIGNVEIGRLARSISYYYTSTVNAGNAPAGHVTPCGASDTSSAIDCVDGEYSVTAASQSPTYDNFQSCTFNKFESSYVCTPYYMQYTLVSSGYTVTEQLANLLVSGKIGVGTTNPSQKIDVNGNVKASGFCMGADCKTSWASVASSLAPSCYLSQDRSLPNPDSSYTQKKLRVTTLIKDTFAQCMNTVNSICPSEINVITGPGWVGLTTQYAPEYTCRNAATGCKDSFGNAGCDSGQTCSYRTYVAFGNEAYFCNA